MLIVLSCKNYLSYNKEEVIHNFNLQFLWYLWYNLNDEDKYENTKIWQFRERERVNGIRRILDFIKFLIKTKHSFNSAFCFFQKLL